MNIKSDSKKLAIQLRANEESYITGQLDLNETLYETERLWEEVVKRKSDDGPTANEIIPDCDLMKLQTGLAKRSAKYYKPDSLVFNPTEFSIKLTQFYDHSAASQSTSENSPNLDEIVWFELGNVAKKLLHTVPSFSFINGTFDPEPLERVKKKRKVKAKDKVGDVTRPVSTNLKDNAQEKDPMIKEAERVLAVLTQLCRKNDNAVCFYEFVTDPTSFVRTVENIFVLSLLSKEGCVQIRKDRNGLPCLSAIDESDRRDKDPETKQCICSISLEEWKDIVKKFNLKKPLLPPRKSTVRR